jgi:EAL domain-containing protein (putative c-di-GMP-specific phosphodiesterase class I)
MSPEGIAATRWHSIGEQIRVWSTFDRNIPHATAWTAVDDTNLASDLTGAAQRGEIVAYYQPQIALATGRIVAIEALSRWRHPSLGELSPDAFIPLAEETGLIHEIGRFMVEEGCRRTAAWNAGGAAIEIAINVSASQLATSDFFDHIADCVAGTSLDPRKLTLEITESQVIGDVDAAAARLSELRALGVGVSIDDFGTGYSSLEQLRNLPATELKIDRTLVQDESATTVALMTAIVGLFKERGLRVVAEGVETPEHLERVRELGCDRAQGFLIGQPMPSADIEELLLAGRAG